MYMNYTKIKIVCCLILALFFSEIPIHASPPAGPAAAAVTSFVIGGIPKVIMLQGSSFEGCPLTYAIVTPPANGTLQYTTAVTFTAAGSLLYKSNSGFLGTDTFTYQVTANTTSSCTATPVTTSPATVTLTVGNNKTQINGSIAGVSGGKISYVLSGSSLTYDGNIASGTTVTANVDSTGHYTVYLYPSYGMNPPQYWNARYTNGAYSANFGPYNVPVSGTALNQAQLETSRVANASQQPLTIANETGMEMVRTIPPPSPGPPVIGTDKQLIYNQAGTLVGNAGLTYDGTNLGSTGLSVSGNSAITGNETVNGNSTVGTTAVGKTATVYGAANIDNTGIGANMSAGWFNNCDGYPMTTFTAAGVGGFSATHGTSNYAYVQNGVGPCVAGMTVPTISITNGNTYKVCFNLTYNSGVPPNFAVTPTNLGGTPVQVSFRTGPGWNCQTFVGNATGSYFATFAMYDTGIPANFSISGFTLTQIDAGTGSFEVNGVATVDGVLNAGGGVTSGGQVKAASFTTNYGYFSNPMNLTHAEIFGGGFNAGAGGAGLMSGQSMTLFGSNIGSGSDMTDTIVIGADALVSNAAGGLFIGQAAAVTNGNSSNYHFSYGGGYGGPPTIVGNHGWGTGVCVGFACIADGNEATVMGPQSEGHGLAVFVYGDKSQAFGTAASGGTGYTIGSTTYYGNQFSIGDGNRAYGYGNFLVGGGLTSRLHAVGVLGGGNLSSSSENGVAQHSFSLGQCNKGVLDSLGAVRDDCVFGYYHVYLGHGDPTLAGGGGGYVYPSPADEDINITNAFGTNNPGGHFYFHASVSTGLAVPGDFQFQTGTVGTTGTTPQTLVTRFTIATGGITAAPTFFENRRTYTGVVGTTTLDLSTGNVQQFTFGAGNETIALSNIANGSGIFTLVMIQDATGSRTATWPGTIKWVNGTAPTLSTGSGKRDVFTFISDGTNLYEQSRALDVR